MEKTKYEKLKEKIRTCTSDTGFAIGEKIVVIKLNKNDAHRYPRGFTSYLKGKVLRVGGIGRWFGFANKDQAKYAKKHYDFIGNAFFMDGFTYREVN